MSGTLTPAYGRDYTSKKEALQDWNDGKDFILHSIVECGPINNASAKTLGIRSAQIRWRKLTMVAVIKLQPDGSWK
jgi:hypothetical protein